ncbi:MAG: hypothetical protein OEX16_02755 [Hadesarchaea archaeon]|nr:hypothetical protein [Hadesarchaea archaeon]MDH5685223.1 hypothetical protein [Hadesarchaea archaeon]
MKKKHKIIYFMPKTRKSTQERENRVGERMSFDEEKEIISLEDAEREAIAAIRRRMHKIENLLIKSSNLTRVGDRYAYEIKARVDTVPQSRGRFRKGKVETQNVEVLIDASSGECIGFSGVELEE